MSYTDDSGTNSVHCRGGRWAQSNRADAGERRDLHQQARRHRDEPVDGQPVFEEQCRRPGLRGRCCFRDNDDEVIALGVARLPGLQLAGPPVHQTSPALDVRPRFMATGQ